MFLRLYVFIIFAYANCVCSTSHCFNLTGITNEYIPIVIIVRNHQIIYFANNSNGSPVNSNCFPSIYVCSVSHFFIMQKTIVNPKS